MYDKNEMDGFWKGNWVELIKVICKLFFNTKNIRHSKGFSNNFRKCSKIISLFLELKTMCVIEKIVGIIIFIDHHQEDLIWDIYKLDVMISFELNKTS